MRGFRLGLGYTSRGSAVVAAPTELHLLNHSGSGAKAADTTDYTLGVVLLFTAPGTITEVCFYKPVGANQDVARDVAIWNLDTQALLASGSSPFAGEPASGWLSIPLTVPLHVNAGTGVVAGVVVSNGGYWAEPNFFPVDYVNGPITGRATATVSGNGRFKAAGPLTFPTDHFNATNYHVDVSFVPD